MAGLDRRTMLAGLGLVLAAGCARVAPGTAGAEVPKGAPDTRPPPEGGIGGTGIVGTLTGFGSLLVNGLSVALPPGLAVETALGPVGADGLAIGQALTIEAAQDGAGLAARRVRIVDPLIGRVDAASADGRRFAVLGSEVRTGPGGAPAEGAWVAVSGLWSGRRVIASRVAPSAAGASVVEGTLRVTPQGGLAVGDTPLRLPIGRLAPDPGSFVTAIGTWAAGALAVERLEVGRFRGAAGPLADLVVEGYLERVAGAPGYRVAGLGHSFDRAARLGRLARGRALFVGPYSGTFDVAFGATLPEDAEARGRALAEIAAGRGRIATR